VVALTGRLIGLARGESVAGAPGGHSGRPGVLHISNEQTMAVVEAVLGV
jgi:hypothetical protein